MAIRTRSQLAAVTRSVGVACAVGSGPVRVRLLDILARAGASVLVLSHEELSSVPSVDSLIYDFAPWDQRSSLIFEATKRRLPAAPILVYPPLEYRAAELASRFALVAGVRLRFQDPTIAGLDEERRSIAWLLGAVPFEQMRLILDALFAGTHAEVRAYVLLTVWQVHHVRQSRVQALAKQMSTTTRTLERKLAECNFPPPKRLSSWIVLAVAAYISDFYRIPVAGVRRVLGLGENEIGRLKRRLFSENSGLIDIAIPPFEVVLVALAQECGIVAERAKLLARDASCA